MEPVTWRVVWTNEGPREPRPDAFATVTPNGRYPTLAPGRWAYCYIARFPAGHVPTAAEVRSVARLDMAEAAAAKLRASGHRVSAV